jgi:hypothetical protein
VEELGTWLGQERLATAEVVAWVVRMAKGVMPLHELGEPHGCLGAKAVMSAGPSCSASAVLVMPDEVEPDVHYYSAERAKLSGASLPDDVWALGVVLYLGLTCTLPFAGNDRRAVRERIEWRPASPIEVYGADHEPLQALLDRLFHPKPAQRLTTLGPLIAALEAIEPSVGSCAALKLDNATEVAAIGAKAVEPRPAPARDAAPPVAATPPAPAAESRVSEPEGDDPRPTPARKARRGSVLSAGVVVPLLALAVAATVYLVLSWLGQEGPRPAATTAPAVPEFTGSAVPSATLSQSAPSMSGSVASGSPSASVGLAGSPSSTAASASVAPLAAPLAAPPKPGDRRQCVSQLFPPETFEASRPNFHFVCAEPDPRKGADALGTEVVLGKGRRGVTPAMREWDKLGWFQMAMFAVVRATCCGTATPLQSSLDASACNFDGSLMALGEAVAHGGEGDRAAAVDRHLAAIRCLVNAHYAHAFGEKGAPTTRERQAFDEVSQRIRPVLGR